MPGAHLLARAHARAWQLYAVYGAWGYSCELQATSYKLQVVTEVYDVYWAEGDAPIGRFYLDMHPRDDKYKCAPTLHA